MAKERVNRGAVALCASACRRVMALTCCDGADHVPNNIWPSNQRQGCQVYVWRVPKKIPRKHLRRGMERKVNCRQTLAEQHKPLADAAHLEGNSHKGPCARSDQERLLRDAREACHCHSGEVGK